MTESPHQARVVETIRRTARWRRAKADEYPEYHQENVRGASALRTLANFVERMPPDDMHLRALRYSERRRDGEAYRLCPEAFDVLSRFGLSRGAWHSARPTERQMRNVLRRVEGQQQKERHAERVRAEEGHAGG
jgi:hypothetical protein